MPHAPEMPLMSRTVLPLKPRLPVLILVSAQNPKTAAVCGFEVTVDRPAKMKGGENQKVIICDHGCHVCSRSEVLEARRRRARGQGQRSVARFASREAATLTELTLTPVSCPQIWTRQPQAVRWRLALVLNRSQKLDETFCDESRSQT